MVTHQPFIVPDPKDPSARQVHAALRLEGEEELARTTSALFWSAVACGLSLGLSLLSQGVLRHHLPDTGWRHIVSSMGYAVGFIALTLGRQELYAGNTLTAVLPFLHDRRLATLRGVARVFALVFIGNMVGAFVFASAAAWTTTFSEPLSRTFAEIGVRDASYGFGTALAKGVFGGWIIALMVWLLPGARHARIWVIAPLAWALAAAELTHVIAGSVNVMFAAWWGQVGWLTFLKNFAAPVLLGNTLGGLVFVVMLSYGQESADDGPTAGSPPAMDPDRPE